MIRVWADEVTVFISTSALICKIFEKVLLIESSLKNLSTVKSQSLL